MTKMHIEDIFEDLEALFDASADKAPQNFSGSASRMVELRVGSQHIRLIAPIIGFDFAAGLDLEVATWHIYSLRLVGSITFLHQQDLTLPRIRLLDQELSSFLYHLPLPAPGYWSTFDNPDHLNFGLLRECSTGFMVTFPAGTTEPSFVPIPAISQISIQSLEE